MTRFAYAAAESASGQSQLQYRTLVDMGVTSSTLYLTNGTRYILPGEPFALANTYSPVGGLGSVEPIGDEASVSPRTLRFSLRAVSSTDLFEPMREDMFNRPITVRRAFFHTTSGTLVSTPEVQWKGFVNKVQVRFNDPEKGNYFEIEGESALRRQAEAMNFNHETLWTVLGNSGDTFFDFITQVPLSKALWGQTPTSFNGAMPAFGNGVGGNIARQLWYIKGHR